MLIWRVPESLSAGPYEGSFAGNPGFCSDRVKDLDQCSSVTRGSGGLGVAKYCFNPRALVVLGLPIACFCLLKLRQKVGTNVTNQSGSPEMRRYYAVNFNEHEILNSINEENLIGHGGSGYVHKVELRCGTTVAVKQMFKSRTGIRRPEFDAEEAILTSIRHINVVALYCSITSEESDLVYEYMPNGSLWDRLHTDQTIHMDWNIRYEIAVGVAKGLEYRHHGCGSPVIHRDVKSANILLDEEMKPKIDYFEVAKMMQTNQDTNSTRVITGTHGYIAPNKFLALFLYKYCRNIHIKRTSFSFVEYCQTFNVTEKSDVCRRCFDGVDNPQKAITTRVWDSLLGCG